MEQKVKPAPRLAPLPPAPELCYRRDVRGASWYDHWESAPIGARRTE